MASEEQSFRVVVGILNEVFERFNNGLRKVLEGSISDFSGLMLEKNLITKPVKESEDFDKIMREFTSDWPFLQTISAVEKQCEDFLGILQDLRGPPERAAIALRKELNSKVEGRIPRLCFLREPMPTKFSSTPENVVSLPTANINRKAYSETHPPPMSMESYYANHKHTAISKSENNRLKKSNIVSNSLTETRPSDQTNSEYQNGEEEENYRTSPKSSQFTMTSKNVINDPRNPVVPGHNQPSALPIPVTPHHATDSGVSISKTQNFDSLENDCITNTEGQRKPVPVDSDPVDKQSTSTIYATCMQPIPHNDLNHNRNFIHDVFDHHRQQESQQANERQNAEVLLRKRYELEIEELKEEKKELRKKCDDLTMKYFEAQQEVIDVKKKAIDEQEAMRHELDEVRRDLDKVRSELKSQQSIFELHVRMAQYEKELEELKRGLEQ